MDRREVAGDEHILHDIIVATAAAQPARRPGVEDRDIPDWRHDDTARSPTVRSETWFVAIVDGAAAGQPVAVLAAAAKHPVPTDAVAALAGHSAPARADHAAQDGVGVALKNLECGGVAQVWRDEGRRAGPDHHDPACCAIHAGNRFDHIKAGERIDLQPTEGAWDQHAKEARLRQILHERDRQPSLALGALGRLRYGGHHARYGVQQLGTVRRGSHGGSNVSAASMLSIVSSRRACDARGAFLAIHSRPSRTASSFKGARGDVTRINRR